MSGKASRDKGARWELAVATWLSAVHWRNARRELERRSDIGDIQNGPRGVHIECKDHARFDLSGWMRQARAAARPDDLVAVVIKRRNQPTHEAFVVMSLADASRLWREAGR